VPRLPHTFERLPTHTSRACPVESSTRHHPLPLVVIYSTPLLTHNLQSLSSPPSPTIPIIPIIMPHRRHNSISKPFLSFLLACATLSTVTSTTIVALLPPTRTFVVLASDRRCTSSTGIVGEVTKLWGVGSDPDSDEEEEDADDDEQQQQQQRRRHPLSSNAYLAGAGTAGDLSHLKRSLYSTTQALSLKADPSGWRRFPPSSSSIVIDPSTAAAVVDGGQALNDLRAIVATTPNISIAAILAGVSGGSSSKGGGGKRRGRRRMGTAFLQSIESGGSVVNVGGRGFAAMGSGGLAGTAFLEASYNQAFNKLGESVIEEEDKGEEEANAVEARYLKAATNLAVEAVKSGVVNDLASGNDSVDVVVVLDGGRGGYRERVSLQRPSPREEEGELDTRGEARGGVEVADDAVRVDDPDVDDDDDDDRGRGALIVKSWTERREGWRRLAEEIGGASADDEEEG
jgi:20S proteasome alpha/beta subunit